jgi:hypothetical protein
MRHRTRSCSRPALWRTTPPRAISTPRHATRTGRRPRRSSSPPPGSGSATGETPHRHGRSVVEQFREHPTRVAESVAMTVTVRASVVPRTACWTTAGSGQPRPVPASKTDLIGSSRAVRRVPSVDPWPVGRSLCCPSPVRSAGPRSSCRFASTRRSVRGWRPASPAAESLTRRPLPGLATPRSPTAAGLLPTHCRCRWLGPRGYRSLCGGLRQDTGGSPAEFPGFLGDGNADPEPGGHPSALGRCRPVRSSGYDRITEK